MVSIHPYSRQIIKDFVTTKLLDIPQGYELLASTTQEEITNTLSTIMLFSPEKVWTYLIEVHWKQRDDVFDSPEMLVFKSIVTHNGIIIKENTKLTTINITRYQFNKAIESLQEQEMIFELILYDEKCSEKDPITIVGLHPKLVKKLNE